MTPLEIAIENALEQVRVELMRLYCDGDVGKVEIDAGPDQIVVKANPVRRNEPVRIERKAK